MNLREAIYDCYGKRLPGIPEFQMCRFKIDDCRNGFAYAIGEYGFFGCFLEQKAYVIDRFGASEVHMEHKENKKLDMEWWIWKIACAQIDRGEKLSREDKARLELAVSRLEEGLL